MAVPLVTVNPHGMEWTEVYLLFQRAVSFSVLLKIHDPFPLASAKNILASLQGHDSFSIWLELRANVVQLNMFGPWKSHLRPGLTGWPYEGCSVGILHL